MPPILYTDHEIDLLIREDKPYRREKLSFIVSHMLVRDGSYQGTMDLRGGRGNNFVVKLRKGYTNPQNFSVILGVYPPERNKLFLLRRYNGLVHVGGSSCPVQGIKRKTQNVRVPRFTVSKSTLTFYVLRFTNCLGAHELTPKGTRPSPPS